MHLGRQASSERLLLAIWVDKGRANAPAGKVGRSGRLGKLIRPGRASRLGRLGKPGGSVKSSKWGRLGKQGTKQAKEINTFLERAVRSRAQRGSAQRIKRWFVLWLGKASDGKGKLQNASLISRCAKRCVVQPPLARFPFLLIQVFVFVVKPMENHTYWHQQGSPKRGPHSTCTDRRRARAYV